MSWPTTSTPAFSVVSWIRAELSAPDRRARTVATPSLMIPELSRREKPRTAPKPSIMSPDEVASSLRGLKGVVVPLVVRSAESGGEVGLGTARGPLFRTPPGPFGGRRRSVLGAGGLGAVLGAAAVPAAGL